MMIVRTSALVISIVLFPSVLWSAETALDLSTLTAEERQVFDRVASEEFCNCQSPMTIGGCLDARPSCKMAQHLGNYIVRGVQMGAGPDVLLGMLSQRVLSPLCAKPMTFDTSGAPARGPASAPITLVEFADFRCGHCQKMAPVVQAAVEKYSNKVRFVFIPFPLGNNPLSVAAAEAFLAAGAQGKLWPMQEALFAQQDGAFDPATLSAIAKRVGLNLSQFDKDLATHKFAAEVQRLRQVGIAAGLDGTPAFFMNGRPFEFDPELLTFEHRFEMELDRTNGSCQ